MPRKRLRKSLLSPQERMRLGSVYSRIRFRAGLEILGEVGRELCREYTSVEQFLPPSDADCVPCNDALGPDAIPWQTVFNWSRGCYIMPVRCRLLLWPKTGGTSIVIGCRQRWLRGDPSVDVERLADETDAVLQAWESGLSGEADPGPRPSLAPPASPLDENKADQDDGDLTMVEFCVASATHSGCPVMVPAAFTKAEYRKVVHALAKDVRRVAQGGGQAMTPAPDEVALGA